MSTHAAHENLLAVRALDDLHQWFVSHVAASSNVSYDVGTLSISASGQLVAKCLGFELVAERRLAASEGRFVANEYRFRTAAGVGSHYVASIYINASSRVYGSSDHPVPLAVGFIDPGPQASLSKTRVALPHAILVHLATTLPRSSAFKPEVNWTAVPPYSDAG